MQTMPVVEWGRHYGGYSGTRTEIIERHRQSLEEATAKREKALHRAQTARKCFDDLGGAAQWKDAKLDWEDYHDDDQY